VVIALLIVEWINEIAYGLGSVCGDRQSVWPDQAISFIHSKASREQKKRAAALSVPRRGSFDYLGLVNCW
jgi:hypothetical protein